MNAPCPLCHPDRETVLWQDRSARVVLVGDPAYPGFCRVIWRAHVAEMTDLAPAGRHHLMDLVFGVETALRQVLRPTKINLASLGNQVPHLHWHVIPRFADDATFPDAIWAAPRRAGVRPSVDPGVDPSVDPGVDAAVLRQALRSTLPAAGEPA